MSNAIAIAAVTAVLKHLLINGATDKILKSALGSFDVSALPPDRIHKESDASEGMRLNLFLYQVTPNPGWRNAALPSRNGGGDLLSNQPLALDLHYLLTAYGTENLGAEMLLGYAMQVLHETPVLSREAVRKALADPNVLVGNSSAEALAALAASELAEQSELLKITPQFMSAEEISKWWSALQTHYRPTVAYQVSGVLIQGRRATKPALPVRQRNVYAVQFRHPLITAVESVAGSDKFIELGDTLLIRGQRLRGQLTRVVIDGVEFTPDPVDVSDTQISLPVPSDLRAGLHALQVAQYFDIGSPPTAHRGIESDLAALALHPQITVPPTAKGELAIAFSPKVAKAQRASLMISEYLPPDDRVARAYGITAPKDNGIPVSDPETATIKFPLEGVEAGTYLVRVQVDGAESALDTDTDEHSETYGSYLSPKVKITT